MILEKIVADKKQRIIEQKRIISEAQMREMAINCDRGSIGFYDALSKSGLSIIGEFKNASPSHGKMNNKITLEKRIMQYNESVDCISCLTEEDHFMGSVEYFKRVREISKVPMIRKDFIVDPYQIFEAKVIGADCILLIVAILTDRQLKLFYELACTLGMDVLVEVHDEIEMKRAIGLDAAIIGINNRNLKNFTVNLNNTKKLSEMVPEETILVSESGIATESDIMYLKTCRVNAVLIGTVFMEAENPSELATRWRKCFDSE